MLAPSSQLPLSATPALQVQPADGRPEAPRHMGPPAKAQAAREPPEASSPGQEPFISPPQLDARFKQHWSHLASAEARQPEDHAPASQGCAVVQPSAGTPLAGQCCTWSQLHRHNRTLCCAQGPLRTRAHQPAWRPSHLAVHCGSRSHRPILDSTLHTPHMGLRGALAGQLWALAGPTVQSMVLEGERHPGWQEVHPLRLEPQDDLAAGAVWRLTRMPSVTLNCRCGLAHCAVPGGRRKLRQGR